jgi:hypothetical protein
LKTHHPIYLPTCYHIYPAFILQISPALMVSSQAKVRVLDRLCNHMDMGWHS